MSVPVVVVVWWWFCLLQSGSSESRLIQQSITVRRLLDHDGENDSQTCVWGIFRYFETPISGR